ncbi:MAG: hypothetical protein FJZ97_13300, partial [Chloroflexi bacterium]|nr:hypothetical protein [Chloroflexota bacterium]
MKDPARGAALGRRGFLQAGAITAGGLMLPRRWSRAAQAPTFPEAERLGRVVGGRVDVKARPDIDSPTVEVLYDDAVVEWLRERVGPAGLTRNQRWVETERGYARSPQLQPVRNVPNVPLGVLPETDGQRGMWAEVSVPYVDVVIGNPPARSPYLRESQYPRLYYS